jgi:hypothetical protein
MLLRLSRLTATLGLAVALLAAWPAAAQAQPVNSAKATVTDDVGIQATCGIAGFACFWVNINFTGTRGRVEGNNSNYLNLSNSSGCTRFPGTWNDCISSIRNDGTQCTVWFWTNANYQGRAHSLARGDEVPNFASAPPVGYSDPAFNDSISSNHWCTAR